MANTDRTRKVIAALVSSTLTAGVATAVLAAGTTTADAAKVQKSYAYKCSFKAGGFSISPTKVKGTVSAKLPGSVKAGSTISKRAISVKLRMPEVVRANVVDSLNATLASGKAVNPYVGLRYSGEQFRIPIRKLAASKARIPAKRGSNWSIRAKGTVGPITVPKGTSGKAKLSVPKKLSVKAKLYRKNGKAMKASMKCKAPKNRAFATVKIQG